MICMYYRGFLLLPTGNLHKCAGNSGPLLHNDTHMFVFSLYVMFYGLSVPFFCYLVPYWWLLVTGQFPFVSKVSNSAFI